MKVAICTITFRRPDGLRKLIDSVSKLRFERVPAPEIEIVVVDNDAGESARSICDEWRGKIGPQIEYSVEPRQGITFARNAALSRVPPDADFIATLDDDEFASEEWLDELLACQQETKADCVTGPVIPVFPEGTPPWIIEGKFFERRKWPDRAVVRMASATNNMLISAPAWRRSGLKFDHRLRLVGSEDGLFFMQGKRHGWRTLWADKATIYEFQPPARLNSRWIVRRQFQIGNGLAFCDLIANKWIMAVPARILKSGLYLFAGLRDLFISLLLGRIYRIRGLANLARAGGGIWALLGREFKSYAPDRVAKERGLSSP